MRDFSNIPIASPRDLYHSEQDTSIDRAIVNVANVLSSGSVTEDAAVAHLLARGFSLDVAVNIVRAAQLL